MEQNNNVWAEPTDGEGRLTDSQINKWKGEGYAVVSGIIEMSQIEELSDIAANTFPSPTSPESLAFTDFGTNFTFPSQHRVFNDITLHRNLLAQVSRLLDTTPTELRLTQSDLWPKYGKREATATATATPTPTPTPTAPQIETATHTIAADALTPTGHIQENSDQRMHVDYPNHTLLHPPRWETPEAVEMIVYLSDHELVGGGTAIVPRRGADDVAYRWPIIGI
jgi:hypothetical protein